MAVSVIDGMVVAANGKINAVNDVAELEPLLAELKQSATMELTTLLGG